MAKKPISKKERARRTARVEQTIEEVMPGAVARIREKQARTAAALKAMQKLGDSPDGDVVFAVTPAIADDANPKDAYGEAKVDLALVPPAASIYMALGFMNGAQKYGPYNWRTKKVKMMVYLAAAKRHIDKVIDGQDLDEESFLPEIGHALASLGIIADAVETGNIIDNRPPKGAAAALLNKWKKPVAAK
jgi:hypothetical protein